ncbi:N-acetylglucosamine-6-phosphate deacetylase [Cohnella pontilimi]|uniref:N-acetylglucosamine-6-phosphate deacetylase n=1 Tax=Cohnella pontilimi TaxID=2564100 RepID=A0A4U0F5G1_9BACL|nr:N-acetylglucosamine-6-phosphate deacetylase [Cohnella pontilimi]TJY39836.1 N-acetylglucosamine-6-phosphate deacetylase [Cohnella pontilimi]
METKQTMFDHAKLYLPEGPVDDGWMLVDENGRIAAAGANGEARPEDTTIVTVDCGGRGLLPGLIDVHVHGGGGYDVLGESFEHLDGMSRFHAAHGTTTFLATTSTTNHETILRVLDSVSSMMGELGGADLAGIHLEGPFIDAVRRGAQSLEHIQPPSVDKMKAYLEASRNSIRIVSMAPEREGGLELVSFLAGRGITVSAGHTNATLEQMKAAVSAGVRHTTHHFNGMSPLHHREPGAAGAGMVLPELTTELICDGIHVHPEVVKLLFAVKGPASVCMITDAVFCAGLPDGEYGSVTLKEGQVLLSDGTSLAGSGLTTLAALRNAVKFTGLPLERILPSITSVPARQAGLSDRKGSLSAGKDADFLVVDEDLELLATYVRGKPVYQRQ